MGESQMENVVRHPEWKRLYDELAGSLQFDQVIYYIRLSEAAGIDIRSPRGRQQFHRFAKEVLKMKQMHFENVPRVGYRVVRPEEHAKCASGRVKRARRRIRDGMRIAFNTALDAMSPEARRENANLIARLAQIETIVREQGRDIKRIAVAIETNRYDRLPGPLLLPSKKEA